MNRRDFLAALGIAPIIGEEIRRTYLFAPLGGWLPESRVVAPVFQYSFDSGATWSEPVLGDGPAELPCGITFSFAPQSVLVGDQVRFLSGMGSERPIGVTVRRTS